MFKQSPLPEKFSRMLEFFDPPSRGGLVAALTVVGLDPAIQLFSHQEMLRNSNPVPIWRRVTMIGIIMIGIATLAAYIDAYFLRSGALGLPVGILFSAGVLCVMFGGAALWFSPKR